MKKFIIITFLVVLSANFTFSQQDPVAGKILDNFSSKASSSKAVYMTFEMTVKDAVEQTENTIEGEVIIKKDKYKLSTPDNILWYNGTALWTLSPEVNEVTITTPDAEDDSFISDPSSLFTMYKTGYKYRLVEETQKGSVIDLYPEDLETDFSRLRLLINKNGELSEAEYKRKDGLTIFIHVKSYNLQKDFPDSIFDFKAEDYKDVDIIDMRG